MTAEKLKIHYYGDPILRQYCQPIAEITDEIRKLALDMVEYMDNHNGIGLSAPQIGKSIRLFVLRNYVEDENGRLSMESDFKVFINPKILSISDEMVLDVEGCLSLPGLRCPVVRPLRITIEATDLNGNRFTEELSGINARVRMHENDHINGVLYPDRVDPKIRNQIEPILRQIKKQYFLGQK